VFLKPVSTAYFAGQSLNFGGATVRECVAEDCLFRLNFGPAENPPTGPASIDTVEPWPTHSLTVVPPKLIRFANIKFLTEAGASRSENALNRYQRADHDRQRYLRADRYGTGCEVLISLDLDLKCCVR
jgi:hypothetical protein